MLLYFFIFLYLSIYPALAWQWIGKDHRIHFVNDDNNDTPFYIKGINWFGGDNDNRLPEGMWIHPMSTYIAILKQFNINSIRIPLSMETITNFNEYPSIYAITADDTLNGKTIRDVYHDLFYLAHDASISILLDFHTMRGVITEYPYIMPDITASMTQDILVKIANEFSKYPNFIGIDLKNEPHGSITWTEWANYCIDAIARIKKEASAFKGLFFVEGIQTTDSSSAWGGSFTGIPYWNDPRVVFSPHVYGISVRGPVALTETWDTFDKWFGFLKTKYPNPIVLGEIGGVLTGDDFAWHYRLEDYLIHVNITDTYYWCMNPDSTGTGGILQDDWTSINQYKIDFMTRLQPDPTIIRFPAIH